MVGKKWRGFLAANGVGKFSSFIRDYNHILYSVESVCIYDKVQKSKGHDVNNNGQAKSIGWNTFPTQSKPGNFRTHILLNQRRRNRGMAAMTSITAYIYRTYISWTLENILEVQLSFLCHWVVVVESMRVYCWGTWPWLLVHPHTRWCHGILFQNIIYDMNPE